MKKLIALVLVLIYGLGMLGCSANKADKNVQVFKTKDITRITFHTLPSNGEGFEVPTEHMEEITTWLGSFTVDKKVTDDFLIPGSNSISVKIEYADGTVIENGLSTTKIDGVEYYMEHEDAPECYLEILEQAW